MTLVGSIFVIASQRVRPESGRLDDKLFVAVAPRNDDVTPPEIITH
jgi:hypothetical protein